MLKSIIILTTTRCDLACQHCLHGHMGDQHDFPLEVLPALLEDACKLGSRHVSLTGGEPGLHPQFTRLVETIVDAGYNWSFVSNGQCLEPYLPLVERYTKSLRHITISLDGFTSQTHDNIRNHSGSFDRALSAVKGYASMGIPLKFSTSLNRINCGEVKRMVNLAESLGVKSVRFGGTIPTDWNQYLVLNDRQSLELFQQIEELHEQQGIKLSPCSSLFTRGGINFCPALALRGVSFNARGELLFCCDMVENHGIIGSLQNESFGDLVEKRVQASANLQTYRLQRITAGNMGEGFDTCAFCNLFFRKHYGQIGRRQFLIAGLLSAAGLALAACTPPRVALPTQPPTKNSPHTPTPTVSPTTEPDATETPLPSATATNTPEPTATETPLPSATATNTPEPTATARYYDHFLEQISQQDIQVIYTPSVVRIGEKLNAIIYLPVVDAGSHGQPFNNVYTVEVEVYTQGVGEFSPGQFMGTRVFFSGDNLAGSSNDGFLIIKWLNPTYNPDIPYIYVFSIYPALSTQRLSSVKMARLRLQEDTPLQTIILAGLPDPATQVTFQDWPTPEPNDDPEEQSSDGGTTTGGGSIIGEIVGQGN